jgi:hypothetical protein
MINITNIIEEIISECIILFILVEQLTFFLIIIGLQSIDICVVRNRIVKLGLGYQTVLGVLARQQIFLVQ